MTEACTVVIGHVDHGKTSLVRALTGIETDRLSEEKQRGLSITNGYAHKSYPEGTLDFIDAPGHEDFIHAMIAGTTGAAAALVVVCATEGIRAQTREHLTIAALLGLDKAIVAVTKSDLVAPAQRATVHDSIRDALHATPFAAAPIVFCSSTTREGLEALDSALKDLLVLPRAQDAPAHSFLPIDRVFTLAGHGTVVTGTLLGGPLRVGDIATLSPEGRAVSLRGLHSRGAPRTQIRAGTRAAVNLRGIGAGDVARGDVLSLGGSDAAAQCMDVLIEMLDMPRAQLGHNAQIRVHIGTAHAVARLRLFGGGTCAAGARKLAQLRFVRPVTGFAGQRAILRSLSPPQTLGHAVVLDPQASPTRANDGPRQTVLDAALQRDQAAIAQALCDAQGGVFDPDQFARISRISQVALSATDKFVELKTGQRTTPQVLTKCCTQISQALAEYHAAHPLQIAAPASVVHRARLSPDLLRHAIDTLAQNGTLARHGSGVALQAHDPMGTLTANQRNRMAQIAEAFTSAGLATPAVMDAGHTGDDAALTALLVAEGQLIELRNVALKQTLVLSARAVEAAATQLRAHFPAPATFTTSQARTALSTSRRLIVPVLEHFDAQNITQRNGDLRQMQPQIAVPPRDAT
jgi:selenocysteine-specific elongation factor